MTEKLTQLELLNSSSVFSWPVTAGDGVTTPSLSGWSCLRLILTLGSATGRLSSLCGGWGEREDICSILSPLGRLILLVRTRLSQRGDPGRDDDCGLSSFRPLLLCCLGGEYPPTPTNGSFEGCVFFSGAVNDLGVLLDFTGEPFCPRCFLVEETGELGRD